MSRVGFESNLSGCKPLCSSAYIGTSETCALPFFFRFVLHGCCLPGDKQLSLHCHGHRVPTTKT
jgi:hypothetical protein